MSQRRFYAGLFLITACTLMLQVLQTRILSVVAWYHLAFFAISMAMFGLTAGAVFVYLRRERFTSRTLAHDLAYFSSAFALSTFACLALQLALAPGVTWSLSAVLVWALLAICMAVPFFFSGVVVSLALTRSPFPIGRVYGVDLLGAAAGCLGVLVLLNLTDAPSGVIWIAAIGAAAALLFAGGAQAAEPPEKPPLHGMLSHRRAILAGLVLAAFANGLTSYGLQPVISKGHFEGGGTYVYRKWNTFSRVAVGKPYRGAPHMWGPSPRLDWGAFDVEQRGMNIDGDAGTTAIRFRGKLEDAEFLRYDVTNLAYFLPDRTRAAVIGVGGGRDVLSAAVFGYRDITAVELNPVFVSLLTRAPYADFTNLASLKDLRLIVDEGRSWFARTAERFDVIQMSLIDTWAATGAGAFSLSENGLYTVEAWRTFLDRLSERGVFTVSRWYNPDDPTEAARLLSLAVAALLERGVAEPRRHIVLAAQQTVATLLVTREPLSPTDLALLTERAAHFEHRILVSPTAHADSPVLEEIANARDRGALEDFTAGFAFDLTPPTDDRPFFFNQLPLDKPLQALKFAREHVAGDGGVRQGNLVASATLIVLFFVALALVLATIVIPLRSAVRDVGRGLTLGGTLYFLFIGLGFMLIEIGLLQRTSVFLGHPVYSLSVLLFTLILATGVGSLLSERLPLDSRAKFASWAVLTVAYAWTLPALLGELFTAFDASPLSMRVVVCIAVIAPAGLLLGFGFPTGMRLIARADPRPTPWFWGVNGAAGVLASIVAVTCSIAFGIGTTLRLGALFYALLIPATLVLLWPRRDSGVVAVSDAKTTAPTADAPVGLPRRSRPPQGAPAR